MLVNIAMVYQTVIYSNLSAKKHGLLSGSTLPSVNEFSFFLRLSALQADSSGK